MPHTFEVTILVVLGTAETIRAVATEKRSLPLQNLVELTPFAERGNRSSHKRERERSRR